MTLIESSRHPITSLSQKGTTCMIGLSYLINNKQMLGTGRVSMARPFIIFNIIELSCIREGK